MPEEARPPISPWPVVSLAAAILACASFVIPAFVSLALVGIVAGLIGFARIRKYEHQGLLVARFGFVASVLILPGTPVWHFWLFNSEAPAGYARLNFAKAGKSGGPDFERYVGLPICLKGYAYPGSHRVVDQFVITKDGEDVDSMIHVSLPEGEKWTWINEPIAVSGTLLKNPSADGSNVLPKYELHQSTIRTVRSPFGVASRARGRGC